MSKKRDELPSTGQVAPPETERDIETGQYKVDKEQALKDWFKNAKSQMHRKGSFSKSIDPKQAAYAKKERKK